MYLPKISKPVMRVAVRTGGRIEGTISAQETCADVPNGLLGKCLFRDGPPAPSMNCTACCALRAAVGWVGGRYAVNC